MPPAPWVSGWVANRTMAVRVFMGYADLPRGDGMRQSCYGAARRRAGTEQLSRILRLTGCGLRLPGPEVHSGRAEYLRNLACSRSVRTPVNLTFLHRRVRCKC